MAKLLPTVADVWRNSQRLALDYGQWRSFKERKAVDAEGRPIPWYTYPAIEYLRSFDFSECDVFEFGCGNSSLFWAEKSRSIISVEDNKSWFQYVNNMTRTNQVVLEHAVEQDYVRSLSEQGKLFHIVAIDGKWRWQCTDEATKYLAPGGMIILDNSDRCTEMDCSKLLRDRGFLQIDFSGFGPINAYCWSTSIFMEARTTLQRNFNGPRPIGRLPDQRG